MTADRPPPFTLRCQQQRRRRSEASSASTAVQQMIHMQPYALVLLVLVAVTPTAVEAINCTFYKPSEGLISQPCPPAAAACRMRVTKDQEIEWYPAQYYMKDRLGCMLKIEIADQLQNWCDRKTISNTARCWCSDGANCNDAENMEKFQRMYGDFVKWEQSGLNASVIPSGYHKYESSTAEPMTSPPTTTTPMTSPPTTTPMTSPPTTTPMTSPPTTTPITSSSTTTTPMTSSSTTTSMTSSSTMTPAATKPSTTTATKPTTRLGRPRPSRQPDSTSTAEPTPTEEAPIVKVAGQEGVGSADDSAGCRMSVANLLIAMTAILLLGQPLNY